jgi:hypothetical protein
MVISGARVGLITGNPWVKKGNPHPPHGKPVPLQRVAGFPLSRVRVFTWELEDLAGSRTVRSCGLESRVDVTMFKIKTCFMNTILNKLLYYILYDTLSIRARST